MANKYRGEVSIRLDRMRVLKFTFNAFAEFEAMTGNSIQGAFADSDNLGFGTMRQLLWAGLIHEDPSLTVSKVGELMEFADGSNLTEKVTAITEQVVKAVQYAFTDPDDDKPEKDDAESKKKPKG